MTTVFIKVRKPIISGAVRYIGYKVEGINVEDIGHRYRPSKTECGVLNDMRCM